MNIEKAQNQLEEYGYSLTDTLQIRKADKTFPVVVSAKGQRFYVKQLSGAPLWSGPDLGDFVKSFWFAKKIPRLSPNARSSDLSHLNALELRLSHERERLRAARTPREKAFRAQQVAGAEREIAGERKFLSARGVDLSVDDDVASMSDDELLAELESNPAPRVKSDVATAKKLARDITAYAQKTARDMGCSFTDAVRAMRRDPGVVAGELGVGAPFVTVWCEGVLARSTG
jgi:hypothetical protein